MGEERRAAHRWLHLLQGGLVPLRDLLRAVGNVCVRHALRSLPVEREDLEALVIVRRLVLDVDRFDLVSVMKVRDDEGLDAGLFGRFLIVVVEVLREEDPPTDGAEVLLEVSVPPSEPCPFQLPPSRSPLLGGGCQKSAWWGR